MTGEDGSGYEPSPGERVVAGGDVDPGRGEFEEILGAGEVPVVTGNVDYDRLTGETAERVELLFEARKRAARYLSTAAASARVVGPMVELQRRLLADEGWPFEDEDYIDKEDLLRGDG